MKKNVLGQMKGLFKELIEEIRSYLYNYTEEDFNYFLFSVDGKIISTGSKVVNLCINESK